MTILLLIFLLLLPTPGWAVLTDSLTSFWELGEASGTRSDSSGTNHLTDNATVTQATGKVGNAAQFTSANSEYLSIADNASISTGNIDWTKSFWIYADTLAQYSMVASKGWGGADANTEWALYYDGQLVFIAYNGTTEVAVMASNFGALSTATWYYVKIYHDSVTNVLGI